MIEKVTLYLIFVLFDEKTKEMYTILKDGNFPNEAASSESLTNLVSNVVEYDPKWVKTHLHDVVLSEEIEMYYYCQIPFGSIVSGDLVKYLDLDEKKKKRILDIGRKI
jgi:hypothetical protein